MHDGDEQATPPTTASEAGPGIDPAAANAPRSRTAATAQGEPEHPAAPVSAASGTSPADPDEPVSGVSDEAAAEGLAGAAPGDGPERPWLRALGRAARVAGEAVGRGAVTGARAVAAGYRAVDPDVRRQVAELPLAGLTMLAPRRPPVEARPDDGARPIVCVHGLQGAAGNFAPLRAFLTAAGRRRHYAAWFEPGGDIESMAARLSDVIAEVLEVNHLGDDAQVDVVAHSMGGLIARLALLDPDTVRSVHTLVTLGTPHHGTHLARLAATSHVLSLRPSSPALERLRHQLPWAGPPALPRLVSLWSGADIMLLPASCAVVDGADNRELPGLTHTGLLMHPTALFATLRALEG